MSSKRKNQALKRQIAELKAELTEAEKDKDANFVKIGMTKDRIKDLEKELNDERKHSTV